MVSAEIAPDPAFHREMMDGVVHHIVTEVAGDEPGEEGVTVFRTENESEKEEKADRKRNADCRGHDEPARIVREVMMDAVHDKMEPFAPGRVRFEMKNLSMQEVLRERPGKETGAKQDNSRCRSGLDLGQVKRIEDHGDEDHEGKCRMDVCENLHELRIEHLYRFVLVGDVVLHSFSLLYIWPVGIRRSLDTDIRTMDWGH